MARLRELESEYELVWEATSTRVRLAMLLRMTWRSRIAFRTTWPLHSRPLSRSWARRTMRSCKPMARRSQCRHVHVLESIVRCTGRRRTDLTTEYPQATGRLLATFSLDGKAAAYTALGSQASDVASQPGDDEEASVSTSPVPPGCEPLHEWLHASTPMLVSSRHALPQCADILL